MDIKLLDSHLRKFLKTDATAREIAEKLSLTSTSIERVHPFGNTDFVLDIEITTNRVDMASAMGIAREAGAVLPSFGFSAEFTPPSFSKGKEGSETLLQIENDDSLVSRICAVVCEVEIKESPQHIKDSLEASGIRSLNNVIDMTNYVMRSIGHPTHVFDYDRLQTGKLLIRPAKKGETIETLDGKKYSLEEGDIIAEDGTGRIVDLLGIMGLQNSVVTEKTKRIVFFIDTCNPHKIRKTSMRLGIRTEAAQLNEKGIDPELAMDALLFGVSVLKETADAKVLSPFIDIYPSPVKKREVSVSFEKIKQVMGVDVDIKDALTILEKLGFSIKEKKEEITVGIPSFRQSDISIPEDIVEEVARTYGYHNIPPRLPSLEKQKPYVQEHHEFFWEEKVKTALRYWGYTEVYTYSMVGEKELGGESTDALLLANPLQQDLPYLRLSLTPSLMQVIPDNKQFNSISVFELANVYKKRKGDLPEEILHLCLVQKGKSVSLFTMKGVLEQLAKDLGITTLSFTQEEGEIRVLLNKTILGHIVLHSSQIVSSEINFALLVEAASGRKKYDPVYKHPPIVEDISIEGGESYPTEKIRQEIEKQSPLIVSVTLLDRYLAKRTFHLTYRSRSKTLTSEDVTPVREKLIKHLKSTFEVKVL